MRTLAPPQATQARETLVYTDGSASAGTKDGGAGVIVTRGNPAAPTILHQSHLRVLMEPISFNTSDSRTLRGTGLHAIGRIFGQAVVDDFLGRGVILVVRQ